MNRLSDLLLTTYVAATWPVRAVVRAQLSSQGMAPLVVLFYHRVADHCPNPWTISCREFFRQMEWLQRHADVISLAELQQRMVSGNRRRLGAHITFDDGYADNCEHALPYLIRQEIPCTYFVSWSHVHQGRPFPHDIQVGKPLLPNTLEQLCWLADAGIEIGAHTRTHADLGQLFDPEKLRDEIISAKDEMELALGKPIAYFAFPYGKPKNITGVAVELARQAGYRGVCGAYGGYNWPGSDPFFLQRIHGDPQFSRFHNWLTLDPRKFAIRPPVTGRPLPEKFHKETAVGAGT